MAACSAALCDPEPTCKRSCRHRHMLPLPVLLHVQPTAQNARSVLCRGFHVHACGWGAAAGAAALGRATAAGETGSGCKATAAPGDSLGAGCWLGLLC
jgi:hypothetical protein